MKNGMKKKVLGIVGLVVLVAALLGVYSIFREKTVAGSKEITIEVINSAEESTVYELKTDAEYLQQAMEEAEGLEFAYDDGPYGATVHTVNGETVNFDTDGAYWGFNVNGEYCNYGISEQPVEDGDAFQVVYTVME